MWWLVVWVLLSVDSVRASQKCAEYTKDGCGGCTGKDFLLGHCGWCWDGQGACVDGFESGPVEGSCKLWEWYGSGGAPGGKCCPEYNKCSACPSGQCSWCQDGSSCVHPQTVNCSNPATSCCPLYGDCASCGADTACQWCMDGSQQGACVPKTQSCTTPDPACCASLSASCASCQANPACLYCRSTGQCMEAAAGLCPAPADRNCCDAVPQMTCATCVASNPACSFCVGSAVCSNNCNSVLNVSQANVWQCDLPELLNCQAQTQCGACVGTSGCIWTVGAAINNLAIGEVCYTGGLFGISNGAQAGYSFTAQAWYYATCELTAVTIIIIFCVCLGGILFLVLIATAICCYLRRKKRRLEQQSAAAIDPAFREKSFADETEPLVPSSVAPTPDAQTSSSTGGGGRKKKKSRRQPKEVTPAVMQAQDGLVNAGRYYQSRQQSNKQRYY